MYFSLCLFLDVLYLSIHNYYAHKKAEREFFETATEMNRMVIQHYVNSQANVDNDNKQIDS